MKPQIRYDKNSKILSFRLSKKKSVDSEMKGNIVIDYDKNGEIVNIEITEVNLAEFSKIQKLAPMRELVRV